MSRVVASVVVLVLAGAVAGLAQQTLQPNASIERKFGPKEKHEFVIPGAGNQRFVVEALQRGIDVTLTVLGPDGAVLASADSAAEELGTAGTERAEVVAVAPGDYRVRVEAFDRPDARPAAYGITLRDVRALSAEEIANHASEREIRALEEQWEDAVDRGDAAVIGRILRRDGFQTGQTATALRSRDQVLADFERRANQLKARGRTRSHTLSEHVVKAAGATAVSSGRVAITTTSTEGTSSSSGQFVHVWAKDADGWKLVGDHFYPFGRIPRANQAPATVVPAVLEAYTGTFRMEHDDWIVSFAVEKGMLTMSSTYGTEATPPFPLTAVSDTEFAATANDELVFVRSADGRVGEAILLTDGPAIRLVRVESPMTRPRAPAGPR